MSEAMTLLRLLHCRSVIGEHVTGWAKDFAGGLDFAVVEGKLEVKGSASNRILFEAEYKPSPLPKSQAKLAEIVEVINEDLVWVRYERLWQELADARLLEGLTRVSLNVTYEQDWDVDGKLEAVIRKRGLGLRRQFVSHKKTDWRLQVEF